MKHSYGTTNIINYLKTYKNTIKMIKSFSYLLKINKSYI